MRLLLVETPERTCAVAGVRCHFEVSGCQTAFKKAMGRACDAQIETGYASTLPSPNLSI